MSNNRHIIAALVTNEPGVLAHVAGMFAARGFNIDSLVVGRTENPQLSRMTIVVSGDMRILEQVRKQLGKLVEVVKVVDYAYADVVERDLMLVRVATVNGQRSDVIEIANLFRARVVDVANDELMIEIAGPEGKLEAFIDLIRPFGIVELARTGVIAMPRGAQSAVDQSDLAAAGVDVISNVGDDDGGVDPTQLPPG